MNKKELADLLNGREYRNEIAEDEAAAAKAAGLVVVFGASDDLMEFRGAVYDELGCYGGGAALLDSKGLLPEREGINSDDDGALQDYFARKPQAKTIDAVWDTDGYSWIYRTAIPHETFEIVDDGEPYCRGIVFALSDLSVAKADPATNSFSDDMIERIDSAIAEALGNAMDCTRTWSAWSYGTMSESDFCCVAGDPDRVAEIRMAVLEAMNGA